MTNCLNQAWFSPQIFLVLGMVALLFVFSNYCPTEVNYVISYFYLYLVLYAYAARFNVMRPYSVPNPKIFHLHRMFKRMLEVLTMDNKNKLIIQFSWK